MRQPFPRAPRQGGLQLDSGAVATINAELEALCSCEGRGAGVLALGCLCGNHLWLETTMVKAGSG